MINNKAYAKINLGLRILRKRNDGYHDIETVFHRVLPYDEIRLEPSSKVTLESDSPHLPTDDENLCIKAAKLLQRHCGKENGVHISLRKNIPIGAGLGGGSSDAASTLLGIVKMWKVEISDNALQQIGLQLGSDVPYFLKQGTAYATGRGEILDYFELDLPYWIVLIYPNVHISTKWAYESIHDPRFMKHKPVIEQRKSNLSLKQILLEHIHDTQQFNSLLQNDFEPVVLHEHETVAYVKVSLYAAGAKFAQMSGSGSTIYGLFTNEQTAKNAFDQLSKRYQVFVTSPNFKPELD